MDYAKEYDLNYAICMIMSVNKFIQGLQVKYKQTCDNVPTEYDNMYINIYC